MKALIADDDPENREILVRMLTRLGWEAASAAGGAEASARAPGGFYDAVFLDLAMPGIDGFEAARRIRSAGARAVLVAVSGAEARDRARESGFDLYLDKPYTLRDLRTLLENMEKRGDCAPGR